MLGCVGNTILAKSSQNSISARGLWLFLQPTRGLVWLVIVEQAAFALARVTAAATTTAAAAPPTTTTITTTTTSTSFA